VIALSRRAPTQYFFYGLCRRRRVSRAPNCFGRVTFGGIDTTGASVRQRLATVAATVVGFVLVLGTGTRSYQVNDDAVMAGFASGDFTGNPDGRLVFIKPLVGFPLSWMYRVLPEIAWCGLTL
jgi:hypothetical protein